MRRSPSLCMPAPLLGTVVLLAALLLPLPGGRAAQPRTLLLPCTSTGVVGTLHTCGPFIEDATGAPQRLIGVNWYGFESNDFVAAGLDQQPYEAIIGTIVRLGYNTLRLPFSDELVETNPIVSNMTQSCPHGVAASACRSIDGTALLAANPSLIGKSALEILKLIVDEAHAQGLYVILDAHRSRAGFSAQENGLWYDDGAGFPQTAWVADWDRLMTLFTGDPALTGVDLFNEPRSTVPLVGDCTTYLYDHGASWGACNGQTNPATNWRAAALQEGNHLLTINPTLLIIVEGVSVYPIAANTFDTSSAATNLEGVRTQPITLSLPGHLVYSPHLYYWSQDTSDEATMRQTWSRLFGYLTDPSAPYVAPIWVGEVGTCNDAHTCSFSDSKSQNHGYWFHTLLRYLNTPPYAAAPPFSWTFWPLNGTTPDAYNFGVGSWASSIGMSEMYGLLNTAWSDLSLPDLQGELFSNEQYPTTATPTATLTPTVTATLTPTVAPTSTAPPPTSTPDVPPHPTVGGVASGLNASGHAAHGGITFTVQAYRTARARLGGRFPYIDHLGHRALWASHISGLTGHCVGHPSAEVWGLTHNGQGRRYHFSLWITRLSAATLAFTLHLSDGYRRTGQAQGQMTVTCG